MKLFSRLLKGGWINDLSQFQNTITIFYNSSNKRPQIIIGKFHYLWLLFFHTMIEKAKLFSRSIHYPGAMNVLISEALAVDQFIKTRD